MRALPSFALYSFQCIWLLLRLKSNCWLVVWAFYSVAFTCAGVTVWCREINRWRHTSSHTACNHKSSSLSPHWPSPRSIVHLCILHPGFLLFSSPHTLPTPSHEVSCFLIKVQHVLNDLYAPCIAAADILYIEKSIASTSCYGGDVLGARVCAVSGFCIISRTRRLKSDQSF